jgi:hypothetical protein
MSRHFKKEKDREGDERLTEASSVQGPRPALTAFCFVGLAAVFWRPAVFSREVERERVQGRERGVSGRTGGRGYQGLGVLYKGRIYLQKAKASRGPISSLVRT